MRNPTIAVCAVLALLAMSRVAGSDQAPDATQRVAAVRAAAASFSSAASLSDEAVAVLRASLADPDGAVRLAAVEEVARWSFPGSFSMGPDGCQGGVPLFTSLAPRSIQRLMDEAVALLRDPSPDVRTSMVQMLVMRDLMAATIASFCKHGRAGVERLGEDAILSADTAARLSGMLDDSSLPVRRAAARGMLVMGPLTPDLLERLLSGLASADAEIASHAWSGVARLGGEPSLATAFVGRLTALPLPARQQAWQAIGQWPVEPDLERTLGAGHDQEPDAQLRAAIRQLVTARAQRLAYTTRHAVALGRADQIMSLTQQPVDADAIERVRDALRDDDPLVRRAAVRVAGTWTFWNGFRFDPAGPLLDAVIDPDATPPDFAADVLRLQDDADPDVRGYALEWAVRLDLDARATEAGVQPGDEDAIVSLSGAMVDRLDALQTDPAPHIRRVAIGSLLLSAPVDARHVARIARALIDADEEIRAGAGIGIARLRHDPGSLAAFLDRLRQLPSDVHSNGLSPLASVPLDGAARQRLQAWADAEGDTVVGRHIRALVDQSGSRP
jgi:hypothetical protein